MLSLKLTCVLVVTCIFALATAQDELRMTKIVLRRMSPGIAPDSSGIQSLSYETDLPFDPSLFEPPPGLEITESK
jgi:hypothetical protein